MIYSMGFVCVHVQASQNSLDSINVNESKLMLILTVPFMIMLSVSALVPGSWFPCQKGILEGSHWRKMTVVLCVPCPLCSPQWQITCRSFSSLTSSLPDSACDSWQLSCDLTVEFPAHCFFYHMKTFFYHVRTTLLWGKARVTAKIPCFSLY